MFGIGFSVNNIIHNYRYIHNTYYIRFKIADNIRNQDFDRKKKFYTELLFLFCLKKKVSVKNYRYQQKTKKADFVYILRFV